MVNSSDKLIFNEYHTLLSFSFECLDSKTYQVQSWGPNGHAIQLVPVVGLISSVNVWQYPVIPFFCYFWGLERRGPAGFTTANILLKDSQKDIINKSLFLLKLEIYLLF